MAELIPLQNGLFQHLSSLFCDQQNEGTQCLNGQIKIVALAAIAVLGTMLIVKSRCHIRSRAQLQTQFNGVEPTPDTSKKVLKEAGRDIDRHIEQKRTAFTAFLEDCDREAEAAIHKAEGLL